MQPDITRLLHDWNHGDDQSSEVLMAAVYERLRQLAAKQFAGERSGHTLQPTALVHEAFLGLQNVQVDWQDRHHFFALAAQMMRRLLVDHARSRLRQKRGGDQLRVELDTGELGSPMRDTDLLLLDDALDKLFARSARMARVLELVYFGGLTQAEVADVLDISRRTVDRDLKLGRAWLKNELGGHG